MEPIINQEVENSGSADVNNNVFNGSIALLAVCITVISLFQIMNKSMVRLVDDMLGISSILFTASMALAYFSIRKNNQRKYQHRADVVFVLGLICMFVSGVLLVLEL